MDKVDVIIIGAGVVGLAIAAKLSRQFNDVLIIDKNKSFGEETSSRNSEVIHAGIYYPQDSLKANFCVSGKEKLYQYCQSRKVPFNRLGKLLVAHTLNEEAYLNKMINNAEQNGVNDLSWVTANTLKTKYPEVRASAALLSPSTGIIDVHSYMQTLLAEIEHNGGMFVAQTQMISAKKNEKGYQVQLDSQGEEIGLNCRLLINSGGLHSTVVANNIEYMPKKHIPTMHWCRGHYFSYQGKSPFDKLIYPIPSDNGLGIHASLDMGGQLKFGPDTQYINELNYDFPNQLKDKFYQVIQKYFPAISMDKLHPAYSGIRPKLQGKDDSFKDFVIQDETVHGQTGLINLFGIDSPGLTSSLAIAEYVVKHIQKNGS